MSDFKTLKENIKLIENSLNEKKVIEDNFYHLIEPILRDYFLKNKKESFSKMAEKLNVTKGAVSQWLTIYLPKSRIECLIKIYK